MAVLTAEQVTKIVQQAGWSGDDIAIAVAVVFAESSFDTSAVNINADGSYDRGLFQINNKYWPSCTDVCAYDPTGVCAAIFAHDNVFAAQGWGGWSTYNNGSYQHYLNLATTGGIGNAGTGQNDLAGFYNPSKITQVFGVPELGYGSPHTGVDFANPIGTPVPSLSSGVVETVVTGCTTSSMAGGSGDPACGGGYGNHPEIRMADGRLILYGHMQDVYVKKGDMVVPGTILGTVDTTGYSTGNHTHVELRTADGQAIDPTDFINAAVQVGASYQSTSGAAETSGIGLIQGVLNGQSGAAYTALAYSTHNAVNGSDSFGDLATKLHYLESGHKLTWMNPVGSVLVNSQMVLFRGLIVTLALAILVLALVAAIQSETGGNAMSLIGKIPTPNLGAAAPAAPKPSPGSLIPMNDLRSIGDMGGIAI